MRKYIMRRLLLMIPVIFGMTILNFIFMNLAPGDPVAMYVNVDEFGQGPSEEVLEGLREQMGLNGGLLERYFKWVWQLLQGNFGFSYKSFRPVLEEVLEVMPATILLNACTLVFSIPLGIGIGVYCALHKYKISDYIITFITFLGRSMPSFWLGLLCILLFSYHLGWLPALGLSNPLLKDADNWTKFIDYVKHLIMPVMVSVFTSVTGIVRSQRGFYLDVMNMDYIRTARSKGLPNAKINFVHTLKNASLPIINMVSGLIPSLLGGSFMIENVFNIRGMGRVSTQAVFNRDYPILMGTCFAFGMIGLICGLLSEILYAIVDPRIRFS